MRAAAADWVRSKRSKVARMPGSWIWIAKPQVPVSAVEPAGAGAAAARANRITAKARNRGICMMTSSGSRVWLWLMVSRGEAAAGSTGDIDFPRTGHWPPEGAIQPARSWRGLSMAGISGSGKAVVFRQLAALGGSRDPLERGVPMRCRYLDADDSHCGPQPRPVAGRSLARRAGRTAGRLKNFHCSPPICGADLKAAAVKGGCSDAPSRRVLPSLVRAPWSLYVEFSLSHPPREVTTRGEAADRTREGSKPKRGWVVA